MFTRDIVSVLVNGKPARRLFPDQADAQSWTTRDCFERIRPDEYDNRFDVTGLLQEGNNEILVAYENLGHAHGYFPMEELAGIRQAGLSVTKSALTHPLEWECATDMGGITAGWHLPEYVPENRPKSNWTPHTKFHEKGIRYNPKVLLMGYLPGIALNLNCLHKRRISGFHGWHASTHPVTVTCG